MITSETHIVRELPFGNQVPTQAQILKRMKKLYVENKPLLPILTACAEQAEAMMHELFIGGRLKEVTIKRSQSAKGYYRKKGYFCPGCKKAGLNSNFQYCPHCGKGILWI